MVVELGALCKTALSIKSVLDDYYRKHGRDHVENLVSSGKAKQGVNNLNSREAVSIDILDPNDLFSCPGSPDFSFIDKLETESSASDTIGIQSSQVEVETCLLEHGLNVDLSPNVDLERFNNMVSPVDDKIEFLDDRFTMLHDYLYDLEGVDPEMIRQIGDNEIMKCLEQLAEPSTTEQDFCNTVQSILNSNPNVVEAFLSQCKDYSLPFLKSARRVLESRNIFISEDDWNYIRKKRLKFRRQKKYKSKCIDQKRQDVMAKILNLFETKHSILERN